MKRTFDFSVSYNDLGVDVVYGIDIFHNGGRSHLVLKELAAPNDSIAIIRAMKQIYKLKLQDIVNIVVTNLGSEVKKNAQVKVGKSPV